MIGDYNRETIIKCQNDVPSFSLLGPLQHPSPSWHACGGIKGNNEIIYYAP